MAAQGATVSSPEKDSQHHACIGAADGKWQTKSSQAVAPGKDNLAGSTRTNLKVDFAGKGDVVPSRTPSTAATSPSTVDGTSDGAPSESPVNSELCTLLASFQTEVITNPHRVQQELSGDVAQL